MTRLLIGIKTCRKHRKTLQRAVSETWLRQIPAGVRSFFVEGGYRHPPRVAGDKVLLDCSDRYEDLALKTYRFLDFCGKFFSFDFILICDDDTYVHIPRLLASGFERYDYLGNLPPGDGWKQGAYAQGGAYVLSRSAVTCLLSRPFESGEGERWWWGCMPGHRGPSSRPVRKATAEDVMVGDCLRRAGIELTVDQRFGPHPKPAPSENGEQISAHHLRCDEMMEIDRKLFGVLQKT